MGVYFTYNTTRVDVLDYKTGILLHAGLLSTYNNPVRLT